MGDPGAADIVGALFLAFSIVMFIIMVFFGFLSAVNAYKMPDESFRVIVYLFAGSFIFGAALLGRTLVL